MADVIFQKFWNDREGVIAIANEMLDSCYEDKGDNEALDKKRELEEKIQSWNLKYDNLLNMRMAGEIEKDRYDEKREEILKEQEKLNKQLSCLDDQLDISDDMYKDKLEILKYGLEQDFDFSTKNIPDEIIDVFIKQIVVCKDCFKWKLNIFPDKEYEIKVDGKKDNYTISQTEQTSKNVIQHRLLSQSRQNRQRF